MGEHFLRMAYQSIRRGIFNQHVLLEAGAFAGLAGGVIGLVAQSPDYPTAPFFAVSVMVVVYHTFSEWLSLIVKTRSSQAVKRLLDLQPETANAHLCRTSYAGCLPSIRTPIAESVLLSVYTGDLTE